MILLLFALIFRAVSIEFRSKVDSPAWRKFWDRGFGIGSLLPPILLGTALGNVLRGVPLDSTGHYAGTFFGLLNPFSVLVGILTLVLFTAHGGIWLAMKSEGELHERTRARIPGFWTASVALFAVTTIIAVNAVPGLVNRATANPLTWLFAVLLLLCAVLVYAFVKTDKLVSAFVSSSGFIASAFALAALSLFPNMLPASNDPSLSLTIYNASSTPLTLKIMLYIALGGMPFVIAYTIFIYRVFRGKVRLTTDSY